MLKLQPYFLLFTKWLKANYGLLILSLILSCICFPKYELFYSSGIDEPLPWVFNYFADGHYALGIHTLFPHGPLAFLLYPLILGNNLIAAIIIQLICSVLLCMCLFKIQAHKSKKQYTFVTIIILLIISIAGIQLQLICLSACFIVLFKLSGKKINLFFALFFCVFNLFIKSYGGIICGLILISLIFHAFFINKNSKLALQIIGGYFLLFFIFWLALYQSLNGSLTFLIGQMELSSNNSEAVSFNQENNWGFIGISLVSFILIPFATKDKMARYFLINEFPILFRC